MKSIFLKVISILIIFGIFSISSTGIFSAPPEKPQGEMGDRPGSSNSSSNVTHSGKTIISEEKNVENVEYSSSTSSENALIVEKAKVNINNISLSKTGDSDGDESDFYGTNAGIFCYNDGILSINGGKITTNGSHANAVFAYNSGVINISDVEIKTEGNNSGAVMVTGGGTLNANNVSAETSGNSSAPIRSDRGGGSLTVNKGKYTSHGTGSPVIYSTADITVNDAKLTSTASEGVVVEGKNSVTLNNVEMEATNTKLNGNSETYKSIFIYQSMSGDADVGTSTFKSKDSEIVNNKGEIIYVTNTSTVIELENNEIVNNDENGGFLKIGAAKWGTSGKNGGEVVLNAKNQKIEGDIIVDNISTLELNLTNDSILKSAVNKENTAKSITLSMDESSTFILTSDTYITTLKNELSDNSNINLNGYTLTVGNEKITNTNYRGDNAVTITQESNENSNTEIVTIEKDESSNSNMIIIIAISAGVVICISVVIIILFKKKKSNK